MAATISRDSQNDCDTLRNSWDPPMEGIEPVYSRGVLVLKKCQFLGVRMFRAQCFLKVLVEFLFWMVFELDSLSKRNLISTTSTYFLVVFF